MQQKISSLYDVVRPPSNALQISQRVFSRIQYLTVTLLIALAACHYGYAHIYGEDLIWRLTSVFRSGREDSIPTAFSALNLLISSILLFSVYRHSKSRDESLKTHWLRLCIIFFILSIDEVAGFHERFSKLQDYTGTLIPVVETHSWVLYGAVFSLGVFLLFFRFLQQINRRLATLFILSGAIFVTGALGLEFLGAWMLHNGIISTTNSLGYSIKSLLEESFEMYGIALFNCTLFAHIVANRISLTLMSVP